MAKVSSGGYGVISSSREVGNRLEKSSVVGLSVERLCWNCKKARWNVIAWEIRVGLYCVRVDKHQYTYCLCISFERDFRLLRALCLILSSYASGYIIRRFDLPSPLVHE